MSHGNRSMHLSGEMYGFLRSLYAPDRRTHGCRKETPEAFKTWQTQARPALRALLKLDGIRHQAGNHRPSVTRGEVEDCGDHTRQRCSIETEPGIRIPFWFLRPRNAPGKCPLAITPHGHDPIGSDTSAGVAHDPDHARLIETEDRDVAVQAVRHGFIAIAPAVRGMAEGFIPDASGVFGNSDCTSHFLHVLLAGRTSIGERVWDMERILDWALALEEVEERDVLMMGNSGGGVLSTFAAACDMRVGIAVASCSFSSFVGLNGEIQHHPCNAVPGIMNFGEAWDVAGLIAPRNFLAVHGRDDPLKDRGEVWRAVEALRPIYRAAGAAGNFEQKFGDGGHRFYSALMWPFILNALSERKRQRQHR